MALSSGQVVARQPANAAQQRQGYGVGAPVAAGKSLVFGQTAAGDAQRAGDHQAACVLRGNGRLTPAGTVGDWSGGSFKESEVALGQDGCAALAHREDE